MSLATSGGLGGAGAASGGLTMAHAANPVQRVAPPQAAHAAPSGTAAPPSAGLLGADLMDKSQNLSLKGVKNVSHLPIVAVDLYGTDSHVAYFPKKPQDPSKGALPMLVSKLKTTVSFQKGEASHKTLRKYLSKSRTYVSLKKDSFATKDTTDAVTIPNPHLWMGLRRIEDAPDSQKEGLILEESSSPAIAEEASVTVGLVVANSTVDGSESHHDDYDRVVFKVRLHPSKKAVSVLPEEAVEMVLTEAQYQTAAKLKLPVDDQEIVDFPFAVAVPAWASHDSAMESLLEAVGNGSVFQRNVAALAGALLLSVDGKLTPVLERLQAVRQGLSKQHQKVLTKEPDAIFEDVVTLLVFGMTANGFEGTAIQITGANMNNVSCLFSEFKVLSNVSVRDTNPISRMDSCTNDLEAAMELAAPDGDGPSGIILCGSAAEQKAMASEWNKTKNTEWKKVPVFQSSPDCIARGTAVLGGVSHGRLSKLRSDPGKKTRAELALKVQNVAPVAVAVRMNYFGGAQTKWTDEKVLFDFDRQIPAGPHTFELSAAECVVHRDGNANDLSEDDFEKAVKQHEGAKGIPLREEAALNFQVQVLQKWTRDGEWKKVGDVIEPLVKTVEKDGNTIRIACESVALDVSLGVTGLLTTSLVGERESVAVANKSARNSAIRYYVGIIFAILFFGGFLFKSYWDEYVLERDTKRLLAYYKHVVPGSFHDGDDHTARYTCYKYRGKKASLWRRLEKKYGQPVLETHQYEAMFAEAETEQDEETVDLDNDDGDATNDETEPEAPDL